MTNEYIPQFTTIATVESPFPEKFGTPRQSLLVKDCVSTLRFAHPINADFFDGIDQFSHLWVVSVFHRHLADLGKPLKAKVHPPRLAGKALGVFATRSPHRPNPIGLSLVEFVELLPDGLVVRGLDLVDGTPVLDIKPYLVETESQSAAKAGWTANVAPSELQISWTESSLDQLGQLLGADKKATVEELIKLDPRPVCYRGSTNAPNPFTSEYGFFFDKTNICFAFTDQNTVEIIRIEARSGS